MEKYKEALKKGHSRFYEFLESRGVLDQFITNFSNLYGQSEKDGISEEQMIEDISTPPFGVGYFFDWDSTPEGFYFWEAIDHEWEFRLP